MEDKHVKPVIGVMVEWRWDELHPLPTLDDYFIRVKEIGLYFNRCVDANFYPDEKVIDELKNKVDKIKEVYTLTA